MDDVLFSEELEGLKHLDGEASDEGEGYSLEVVVFDKLVEVDGEELEGDDQVGTEDAVVQDLDDVVCVLWILLLEMLQYLELHPCLVLVSLLVLDDLDSHHLLGLMVETFQRLAETAFP